MVPVLKVLSAILSYPEAAFQHAASELESVLHGDVSLPATKRAALQSLVADMGASDLLDLQSEYVDLFDRTRALSLHMFEHVHGESRDRGQAMVSLRERYRQAGLDLTANELPDYIPLFLEFLSLQPPGEAQAMLAEAAHIFSVISERLQKRGSRYFIVFEALVFLAAKQPDREAVSILRQVPLDDPRDLAALDRAWEESEVRFGPGDADTGGCSRAGFRKPVAQEKSSMGGVEA